MQLQETETESCNECEGQGKVKDSTGFYHIRCKECLGTGVVNVPEV